MKIHKNYISKQKAKKLYDITKAIKYTRSYGFRKRMGSNKNRNLSDYYYARWDKFPAIVKAEYESCVPNEVTQNVLSASFLKLEKDCLLDEQNTWANDTPYIASFLSIALRNKQTILINGEKHVLNAGDAIRFDIDDLHEIPRVQSENAWQINMISKHIQIG